MENLDLLLVFVTALAGGFLPLLVRWDGRRLHLALALSTGIFLGAVFLHLLPSLPTGHGHGTLAVESIAGSQGMEAEHAGHAHSTDAVADADHANLVWMFVLLGVLAVYLLEALVLRTHDHDDLHRHRAVGWAALWGLSVHALTAGMAWSVAAGQDDHMGHVILLAILAHKAFESFSLSTVFLLGEIPRGKVALIALLYALVTPMGALLGQSLLGVLGPLGQDLLMALAAGTFLFVCLCELLGEVFHHKDDIWAKLALLGVGVGLMVLTQSLEAGLG
ncbi:MAG TPA: hypothetical protein EYQ25_11410 [Planctomycetes bacterium]|nr:hypothetical protein [Planctomycetota bacterium]HIL36424.1 hypothetical protein [Planctomycetota bacterium]